MTDTPLATIVERINQTLENVIAPEIESTIVRGQLFAVVELLNQLQGKYEYRHDLMVQDIQVGRQMLATLIEAFEKAGVETPQAISTATQEIDLFGMSGDQLTRGEKWGGSSGERCPGSAGRQPVRDLGGREGREGRAGTTRAEHPSRYDAVSTSAVRQNLTEGPGGMTRCLRYRRRMNTSTTITLATRKGRGKRTGTSTSSTGRTTPGASTTSPWSVTSRQGRFSAFHVVDGEILLYLNHIPLTEDFEEITDGKIAGGVRRAA